MPTRPGFEIGSHLVDPGTRRTVDLPVSVLSDHTPVTMSAHVIHGKRTGPVIFVSAAIHGDEIIGVETATAADVEEFDPTLYGMAATYDEAGNYVYPDGFDPETGEWLEGFDEQRAVWEDQYAKAHTRWEAHVKQQAEAKQADIEASEATSYSSATGGDDAAEGGTDADGGSLASDEALQALREKLTGGAS